MASGKMSYVLFLTACMVFVNIVEGLWEFEITDDEKRVCFNNKRGRDWIDIIKVEACRYTCKYRERGNPVPVLESHCSFEFQRCQDGPNKPTGKCRACICRLDIAALGGSEGSNC